MGSVGLGGLAGFLGIFWMNGALVGALFGAFGAKMTGEMADRYAREVEDFKFLPLRGDGTAVGNATGAGGGTGTGTDADMEAQARRLRVTIGINGWLDSADDVVAPWRALPQTTEVFALRYEMASLLALGAQLRRLVHSAAWNYLRVELLKRTVLATVQGALWPLTLLSSASALDNPFTLARNRSDKAGAVLADALANRVQGERPVTLVGYSLGARVVYACLRELAKRQCFGVVDTVVLIGAPVPSSKEHWEMMRCVVAGRLFNVHSENDYILGFLYRGTSLQLGIAGLQAVGHAIDGVEDLDLTNEVLGHTRYPDLIPQILNRCGFGGVRGGEEKIEREDVLVEEGIGMRDSDYPELGTLIDVGDADEEARPELPPRRPGNAPAPGLPTRKPVLPPRRSTRDRLDENAKYLREIKNDPRLGDQDFFLVDKAKATATTTTSSSSGTRPPIRLSDAGPSLSAPDVLEKEKERGPGLGAEAEQRAASFSSPATYGEPTSVFASNVASASYGAREHRVDSEDEYGDAPITMMDDDELSDGELAMVEPLCIDDEVPVKGQAQTGR
ncbi:hypothetical protein F4808DRAFT_444514 [Astrocystis sublimbata]|nr:hypothetical protein F4808DRAFT_444514 [Astrocystis sublimbata]